MDIPQYKTILENRLEELGQRLETIEDKFESSGDAPFDGDAGNIRSLGVLDDLDDMSASEARAIHAALDRIKDGTYGLCVTCTESIDAERLKTVPHTPFCRDHA